MRRATSADFLAIVEMAQEFNHGYYGIPLAEEKLRTWFDHHLANGVILMGRRSYVSAIHVADPLRDWTAVVETGWYSDDGQGARLMLGLINYAREVGADELRASTLNTSPPEAEALLSRLGFEMSVERSHRLQL